MFYQKKKKLLGKAAAIKRFEYLPSGKELKAQTSAANKKKEKKRKEKQYQKLDKVFESNSLQ